MGKTSSTRASRADSEVSYRSERRKTQDDMDDTTSSRRRSQAESVTSSNSRRRSSRKDDDRYDPEDTRSNRYTSHEYTNEPLSYVDNASVDTNDSQRKNESDLSHRDSRRESKRESLKSSSRSQGESVRALDDESESRRRDSDRRDSERSKRRDSKRDSKSARRSDQGERSRALDDHDAALPQNQFPGSFPDTNTQPYRPPGQAADYYGDQGESVQYQPGVRPQGPAYVTNAEQAHLHAPSAQAKPPTEPSSIGQTGAAASYFNNSGDSDNGGAYNSTSSRPPATSSPRVNPTRPGRTSSTGGSMSAAGAMGAVVAGTAAANAAQYVASNNAYSSTQNAYYDAASHSSYHTPNQNPVYQGSVQYASPSGKPSKQSESSSHYAAMGAAGLAGAAAAGYYAQHHHHHNQEHGQHSPYAQGANTNFVVGQGQSAFPGMQQQLRHKHRGPLTKLADWFRDPQGVSQFEQYSEMTGICRYCFDPNSSAMDAPRKHYYHKSRPAPQPGKYGATNKVEKPYRYSSASSTSSSSDDDRKRKRSSTATKAIAGGLAAYGAAKVGETMFNHQNNFDDTYSVKSGRFAPSGASQVLVNRTEYEDDDMYGSGSRKRSSRGSRYSVSEEAELRRKDSTSSRKSRHEEKRSSRRRGSSTSPSGLSRGAMMSVGAAAGAAGIAAMTAERRRSRSRSKDRSSNLNRKRSYYSKRVSPRHSYVDLSTKASGAVGFGQFFSSPSANEKRGKKKGFFTWKNDSSSSSDADLAFGEGTVRRKSGKQGRSRRDSPSKLGDTAAILGLAATGAALAAESDRRKSKSRRDANDAYTGYGSKRTSTNRIDMRDHGSTQVDGDGVWEDASDDDTSSDSVDTALAYGGRLSNRNSRESLAEKGTSKWAWRWNNTKEKPTGKERRHNDPVYPQTPPHRDAYNMASAGMAGAVGAGVGIAAATMMDNNQPKYSSNSTSPLPPMQFVEPFSASDPHLYEARRVSKFDHGPSPHTIVSRSPAPLQQPQAVIAPGVAPIPAVLNRLESDAQWRESPTVSKSNRRKDENERRFRDDSAERTRPRRRNSSPALVNPSNLSKNSVTWDLTDEQLQNEQRALDKQGKRRRRRDDEDDRRRSADFSTTSRKASEGERASESRKESLDRHETRRTEIDRELQDLYAKHKRQIEEQKIFDGDQHSRKQSDAVSAAVIGAGVVAAASAIMSESKKSSESDSEKKPRRKSSLKRGSIDTSVASAPTQTPTPPKETQRERTVEAVAPKVKRSPSPSSPVSPVHDDYASFFVPAEVAEHVKEHNDAAEKRERDREVIDYITPEMLSAGRKQRFDPWLYSPYRPGKPHEPNYHPRGVPKLDLIEATPPGSPGGSRLKTKSSPLSQKPMVTEDTDVAEQPLDRDTTSSTGSKVNWGDNSTHVYDVETPEYERNDPTADLEKVRTIDDEEAKQISREDGKRARDIPSIKETVISEPSPEPSPMAEVDVQDMLGGQSYQQPFYESVSDVGEVPLGDDKHRDIPKTGHGFAVPLPDSPADERTEPRTDSTNDQVVVDEITTEARPSRTDRRRLERALSSSENVTPAIRSSEPESAVVEPAKQMPGGFGVFDYLVDDDGQQVTPEANREIEASAASVLSRRSQESSKSKNVNDDYASFTKPKPKRAATFGDIDADKTGNKIATDYASDPEEWERSTKKSKNDRSSKSRSEIGAGTRQAFAAVAAGAAAAAAAKAIDRDPDVRPKDTVSAAGSEPDFYASSTKDKKKRRSKRESEIFDDYDNKSVVSLPATKDEDRKSRRRSRRDSEAFDDNEDDSKSVASMPATKDEDSRSKRRSKDKEKEKEKRSSGVFGGIFSSNKSDVSTSSKKSSKSSKSESRASRDEDEGKEKRRKRRSKSTDDYDDHKSSARTQDRSESLDDNASKPYNHEAFAASIDDGFVSADDGGQDEKQGDRYNDEKQSFLARGLEMPPPMVIHTPMVTDGVSGLPATERQTSAEALKSVKGDEFIDRSSLPPLPDQDEDEQAALQTVAAPVQTPSADRTRRLSALRTDDGDLVPVVMSSPTAVPLPFGRRGPFTPVSVQRSTGSPSIGSPLTTPRTRMNRPKSSSGKDFKPLYLVERHSYQKTNTSEVEETLPSLPSSRASSAHSSLEDLRGTASLQTDPELSAVRGRRHSYSSIEDHTERRQSPDYLDSRAATPVPGDKQKAREREMLEIRERKEKEKQWKSLFHSPSELLQDPALNNEIQDDNVDVAGVGSPLPSVVSTDHDQEFMSAESRPDSPVQETGASAAREPRSRSTSLKQQSSSKDASPTRSSKSRSKSRDIATAAGLGIAGGMMAGFAANSIIDSDTGKSPTEEKPVKTVQDDISPEPSTSRKSKKDKKKKRKTLDLSEPASANTLLQREEEGFPTANDGEFQQLQDDSSKMAAQFAGSADQDNSSKKSKKDKKKGKRGTISEESLPTIDTDVARQSELPNDDEPATAVLTNAKNVDSLDHEPIEAKDAFMAAVTAKILADKDISTERKQEGSTFDRPQLDAAKIESPSMDRAITPVALEERFVPTVAQMNQPDNHLGAFEEAFERAVHARGLKGNATREEAIEMLLTNRHNAPCIPNPELTPVPEGSPVSMASPQEERAPSIFTRMSGSGAIQGNYESKTKELHSRDTSIIPETTDEAREEEYDSPLSMRNPFGNDFEIESGTDVIKAEKVDEAAPSVPHFEHAPLKLTSEQDGQARGLQQDPEEANEDDFVSALPKKEKKKKKNRSSANATEPVAELAAATDLNESFKGIDEPVATTEPGETGTPADEEWDFKSTKKSKKAKKNKKGQTKLDWDDLATAAAAGATTGAMIADTQIPSEEVENTRNPAVEPESSPGDIAPIPKDEAGTDSTMEKGQTAGPASLEADALDFAPVSGKKSKKDKKRKSKLSSLDEWPQQLEAPLAPMLSVDGEQESIAENVGFVNKSTDEDGSRDIHEDVRDSLDNAVGADDPLFQEDQGQSGSLSRKASKKEKKKKKGKKDASIENWAAEPDPVNQVKNENNSRELSSDTAAIAAVATGAAIAAVAATAIATEDLSNEEKVKQNQSPMTDIEPQDLEDIKAELPIEGKSRDMDNDTAPNTEEVTRSAPASGPPQPDAPMKGPQAPPNPFAVNLSMADAIALSMGQNLATLTAAKPKKKKKAAVGQGSAWTTWTPTSSAVGELEEIKESASRGVDDVTETLPSVSSEVIEVVDANSSSQPTDDTVLSKSVEVEDGANRHLSQQSIDDPTGTLNDTILQKATDDCDTGDTLDGSEKPVESAQDAATTVSLAEGLADSSREAALDDFDVPKKSKKDKKKKRKSTTITPEEDEVSNVIEDSAQPVSTKEPVDIEPASLTEEPAPYDVPSEDLHTAEAVSQEAESEDLWSYTSKKSKKDKKNKRKSMVAEQTTASAEGASANANSIPDMQIDDGQHESAVLPATDDKLEISELHEASRDLIDAPAEDEWSVPIKMSKKDKKKKRKSLTDVEEMATPLGESSDGLEQALPPAQDSFGDTSSTLPVIENLTEEPNLADTPKEVLDNPQVDEWSMPTTSSKKEKKKKKRSAMTLDAPSTPIEESSTNEQQIDPDSNDTSVEDPLSFVEGAERDQAVTEVAEEPAEDEWALPKSSKKEKKKKKKAGLMAELNDTELSAADAKATEVNTDAAVSAADQDEKSRDVLVSETNIEETAAADETLEEPNDGPPEDDDWAFESASSKKSKKKKGTKSITNSGNEPDPEAAVDVTTPTTTQIQPEAESAKDLVGPEDAIDDATASPIAVDSSQEPNEEEWASFTTKPSKKDKKKKRKSAISPFAEESLATESGSGEGDKDAIEQVIDRPVDTEVPSSKEAVQSSDAVVDSSSQEPQVAADEEWAFTRKASKKDKKKKKKDQNREVSEPEESTSKPDSLAEHDAADNIISENDQDHNILEKVAAIKDRSAIDLHSHDAHQNWLSAAHEASTGFPAKTTLPDLTDDKSVIPASSQAETKDISSEPVVEPVQPPLESESSQGDVLGELETAREAEADQEFTFAPTKKSKKDKKKNKRKSSGLLGEDESGDALIAATTLAGAAVVAASTADQGTKSSLTKEDDNLRDKDKSIDTIPVQDTPEASDASIPGAFEDVLDTPEDGQVDSAFASALATPGETESREQEEVSWTSAFKKNKKDKKKRKSVTWSDADTSTPATPANEYVSQSPPPVDESVSEPVLEPKEATSTVEGASIEDEAGPAADVSTAIPQTIQTDLTTPASETEDLEWPTASKKKSKKDKKNRRIVLDEDIEQPPVTTSIEPDKVTNLDPEAKEDTNEDWTDTSSKKKKKDKKKKRNSSALDSTELDPESNVLDVDQNESAASIDRMLVDEEQFAEPSSSEQQPNFDHATEITGGAEPESKSEEDFASLSKPDIADVREPVVVTEVHDYGIEKDAVAEAEEEWAPAGSKSKKDKKKKKKQQQQQQPVTGADESVEIQEAAALASATAAVAAAAAAVTASPPGPETREDEIAQNASADDFSYSKSFTDVINPVSESPIEEEWSFGTKSKKDKKKKRQSRMDEENENQKADVSENIVSVEQDTEMSSKPNLLASFDAPAEEREDKSVVEPEPMPELEQSPVKESTEEEWAFTGKKSKKDKKKKRQSHAEQDNEEQEWDLARAEPVGEQAKDGPVYDNRIEMGAAPTQDDQARSLVTEPEPISGLEHSSAKDEIPEEEWSSTSKKSKKDKKKKRKSTLDPSKAGNEETSSLRDSVRDLSTGDAQRNIPDYVRDFSTHELHQAPGHQDYLTSAHTIANSFPGPPALEQSHMIGTATENPKDVARSREIDNPTSQDRSQTEFLEDSDVGSDVSEETRERRRRRGRRSPPLTRDHDPEDLPRDRALTPPPDHEDMMDTALTIAAGLGFGESQDQPSQSDPVKPQSLQTHQRNLPNQPVETTKPHQQFQSQDFNRDSGIQFESPVNLQRDAGAVRDSGFVSSPPLGDSWPRSGIEEGSESERRRTRPASPTSSTEDLAGDRRSVTFVPESTRNDESFSTPARRQPLPVDSATKERSSVVFNSSPAVASTPSKTPRSARNSPRESSDLHVSIPESHYTPSARGKYQQGRAESPAERGRESDERMSRSAEHATTGFENNRTVLHPTSRQGTERSLSPSKLPLDTIHEGSSPMTMAAVGTAVLGLGTAAFASNSRDPDDPPQVKSLGSSKTRTTSHHNLRSSATTPNNLDFTEDAAAATGAARGMSGSDIYDGFGSFPGSPISPTRPPSVRKRQSMQQIKDLEARVDQLANENRSLAEAKLAAERHLEEFQSLGAPRSGADDEALESANHQLQERDHEINKLRAEITALAATHATLKTSHDEKHAQWETSSRELVGLRSQHEELSSGMEDIVKHEIATALAEKNAELQRLRLDLENARLKIRELQSQILARGADDIVVIRDEDYFDNACQNLCKHVQGWVVRFSKFSDTRMCRSMKEVRDEKVLDRFDNALLDGSDIDPYLADRVRRRDIFMSVVMTMIWEYVFTRYLFGMDRDQRQKLKQLEKNLAEVGPTHAVHQWRALTLTLLSKRESFRAQCESDTEAVVVEVMKALSRFLPPPQNLEAQISESLRKVMKVAVELSIEMRTQRAEYVMLPPLQPEFDTQGDLTQKVYFQAHLMNERSGEFESNEQLEESKAVVRIVLFPLVVKKGDDNGRGEAEFVVCPAQVLVARADKGKRPKSRITSAGSAVDARSLRAASTHSLAMSGVDMTGAGNMI